MKKLKKTVLEINLNSLEHNLKQITSKIKSTTKVMAVVKANAYGSDLVRVAKKLESLGIDYFSVAYSSEGVKLRNAGIKKPILVLIPQAENIKEIVENDLEPSLYSFYFLNHLISYLSENLIESFPCHFKINSGLNRIGFKSEEINIAISKIKYCNRINIISIYSHLAASEDKKEKNFTQLQIKEFSELASSIIDQLDLNPVLHMSNTSGILNYPESEFDMVRCGLGLYGYSNHYDESLIPIHSLKTIISQIISIEKGESVGYNRSFISSKKMDVGIIPLGHADGISRSFAKGGFVLINNKKAKILGNICMDVFMVDLENTNANEGDEVVIFNEFYNAEEFARNVGTISYEILTNLSSRITRKVIG